VNGSDDTGNNKTDDKEKPVLIKMTMRDIEYTEPAARKEKSKLEIFFGEQL
jgi:hypothetical protein